MSSEDVYNLTSLEDLVGNTPLISIRHPKDETVQILAKCEWMNPSGSVKDRAAYSIFKHALRSGSCILRQEERMYEWFEPFLKEWVHYIPVRWDLSDLFRQLEWAKNHDDRAQYISSNAKVLGRALFSPEIMACYTYFTVTRFHKKVDIDFELEDQNKLND